MHVTPPMMAKFTLIGGEWPQCGARLSCYSGSSSDALADRRTVRTMAIMTWRRMTDAGHDDGHHDAVRVPFAREAGERAVPS
jgi:hypothetical protein